MTNSQTSWWSVHEYVSQLLDQIDDWPLIGTPAWCALDDEDPRKLAAIFSAAEHWALRVETCQEARCEMSKDIAASLDWWEFAKASRRRRSAYIPRKKTS
jgi:Protein of unknown function (DUF2742)